MQERILGTRDGGLKVSAIGLGCMGITYGHGDAMDYASAEKLLQSAVEMGITLFDSAEFYDGNEEVKHPVCPRIFPQQELHCLNQK